ncbi:MAG: hypothetical protein DMF60_06145 [Acidobacteria bacterium]|nr:MAG: hypothetical protein DMF60_06145 [Acidobacteriota bacterium]
MFALARHSRRPITEGQKAREDAMTARISSILVALIFLLAAVGVTTGARTSGAQDRAGEKDTRKNPNFDPTQVPGEDLGPLLKGKKFSNGKHTLKTFADGTKLSIETKNSKIKRAFLIEADGSTSDATIHSQVGPTLLPRPLRYLCSGTRSTNDRSAKEIHRLKKSETLKGLELNLK